MRSASLSTAPLQATSPGGARSAPLCKRRASFAFPDRERVHRAAGQQRLRAPERRSADHSIDHIDLFDVLVCRIAQGNAWVHCRRTKARSGADQLSLNSSHDHRCIIGESGALLSPIAVHLGAASSATPSTVVQRKESFLRRCEVEADRSCGRFPFLRAEVAHPPRRTRNAPAGAA